MNTSQTTVTEQRQVSIQSRPATWERANWVFVAALVLCFGYLI